MCCVSGLGFTAGLHTSDNSFLSPELPGLALTGDLLRGVADAAAAACRLCSEHFMQGFSTGANETFIELQPSVTVHVTLLAVH